MKPVSDAVVRQPVMTFRNRAHAGVELASRLAHYASKDNVIVLTLPLGGVVVGHEVARALSCPLDVIITRKIPFPGQPNVVIAVVSETGAVIRNTQLISTYKVPEEYIKRQTALQLEEIEWRRTMYRGGRHLPVLKGKTVILVDDGVVTGAILKSAILALLREQVGKLVVAAAVAGRGVEREIHMMVDEVVCLEMPKDIVSVDSFYKDFSMVGDEEIMDILMTGRSDIRRPETDMEIGEDVNMVMGYMSRAGQTS